MLTLQEDDAGSYADMLPVEYSTVRQTALSLKDSLAFLIRKTLQQPLD
jgi:hypothetical protein